MSRVAKNPVAIPQGVEVMISDAEIAVKGPLGTLRQPLTGEVVYIERKKKRWEGNAHTHICRQGETAYAVGQSYAIRTRSIEKLNRLKTGSTLEKGQQIRIK